MEHWARTARKAEPAEPQPKRRLKGEARIDAILRAAAQLFAEGGFGGTTRQIAERLGVTQALLYKFFSSKDQLIDRVYETHFRDRWDARWDRLLADDMLPLEQRLVRFYGEYAERADAVTIRLFVHAGLAGRPLPGARGAKLTDQIFAPVIAALRQETGLPSLSDRPMIRGERELCMQLHSSVVFLGIRRHVYQMPMPDDLSDVIALYVRSFIAGAPAALKALHADDSIWQSLRVQQLRTSRR
jgi:AcrR family transcriptional regulator